MFDSKSYLKMETKKQQLQEELDVINEEIKAIREEAKKLKKGSYEREYKNTKINQILASNVYISLKSKIDAINYCINCLYLS